MEKCFKCNRLVAGQTLALNKKFLGRSTERFMCFDCLVEFVGTTREALFNRIHDFIEIEKCPLFDVEKFDSSKKALINAQKLPLQEKIKITCERITEWYYHFDGQVYVSFSGGKDSTVLLHIARELFPDIEAVFVNTGLEYPEIQKFVKSFDNVTILRPEMRFDEVIKKHGYPLISKEVSNTVRLARDNIKQGKYSHRLCKLGIKAEDYNLYDSGEYDYEKQLKQSKFKQTKWKPLIDLDCEISDECCGIMKKAPLKQYQEKTGKMPIIATMAEESMNRENAWFKNGCNAFKSKEPKSTPMAFWKKQDVLWYIKQESLSLPSVYGDVVYEEKSEQTRIEDYGIETGGMDNLVTTGCDRTGCIFCAFGCHREKPTSRFERLKETHPRQYEYCIGGGEYVIEGYCQNSFGEFRHFVFEHDDGTPYTLVEIENFIEENKDNTNFKFERKWQPNKEGLGLGHVFDELNKIYGEGFIKY